MRGTINMIVAIGLLAAMATGCADGDDERAAGGDGRRTNGTVVIEPVRVEGGAFIEGFVATAQVQQRSDVDERELDRTVEFVLERGSAFVSVRVRPCSGNCGTLDAGFSCTRVVNVRPGEEIRVEPLLDLAAGSSCSLGGACLAGAGTVSRPVRAGDLRGRTVWLQAASRCAEPILTRNIAFSAGPRRSWTGAVDCNSSGGRWSVEGRRVRIVRRHSTLIGCSSPVDINPEDIAAATIDGAGTMRFTSSTGDLLAFGWPATEANEATSQPHRQALSGTIIEQDDETRICSVVFTSLPPGCGGQGPMVRGLDGFAGEEAGGVRWSVTVGLIGRLDGKVLDVTSG